jgi:hypothetical protein
VLTRRAFVRTGAAAAVAGVAAVAALETGVVPGRARVHDLLGLTGPDGVVPDVPAGPVVSGSFDSFGRRTKVGYSIIYPDGYDASAELPVVLVLHGRGGDHMSAVRSRWQPWTGAGTATGIAGRTATIPGSCSTRSSFRC